MVTGQRQLRSPVVKHGSQDRQPGTAIGAAHRSPVLRAAGSAEPADGVPVATGGDGGFLPQGRGSAARDVEPDLRRDDAVHGNPADRADPTVLVPRDRSLDTAHALQVGGCARRDSGSNLRP